MSFRLWSKFAIMAASLLLLASCSSIQSRYDPMDKEDIGATSRGLGSLSNSFAGQQAGESYTSKAPHNQVYLFAYDNSTIAPKYLPSIKAQAKYLKNHPNARILLAGHTDERGSREYNVALGERRANTIADLMRMAGVKRQQIRVVSYGKERPVKYGHSESDWLQNRRVELIYEATR